MIHPSSRDPRDQRDPHPPDGPERGELAKDNEDWRKFMQRYVESNQYRCRCGMAFTSPEAARACRDCERDDMPRAA